MHTSLYSKYAHQVQNIDANMLAQFALDSSVLHHSPVYSSVHILAPIDDLLSLVVHAAKHFFHGIMDFISVNGQDIYSFNLRQLVDIDLHMMKYLCHVDELLDKAAAWSVVPECIFVLKIMELYSPEQYTFDIMRVYESHRRKIGFYDLVIDLLLKSPNFPQLVLQSNKQLAEYVMSHLIINEPMYNCYLATCFENLPNGAKFNIDETLTDINNRYKTHFKVNKLEDYATRWRCAGAFRQDDKRLWFKMDVKFNNIYLKGLEPHIYHDADRIMIYFINFTPSDGHPYLRKFTIRLCFNIETNEPFISCEEYDFANKRSIDVTGLGVACDWRLGEKNYELELGFAWELIENTIVDNKIIFNIDAFVNDQNQNPSLLSLASNMHYFENHDVSSFACLQIADRCQSKM